MNFDYWERVRDHIYTYFCPFCSHPFRIIRGEDAEYPASMIHPCFQCKTELTIKFDYNSMSVEFAYDSNKS